MTKKYNWCYKIFDLPKFDSKIVKQIRNSKPKKYYHIASDRVISADKTYNHLPLKRWQTPKSVEKFVKKILPPGYHEVGLQVIGDGDNDGGHGAHTDKTRSFTFFYLIDAGGNNVQTRFFKEKKKTLYRKDFTVITDYSKLDLVESIVIEPHKWYLLNQRIIHDVYGIENIRKSITASYHWCPVDMSRYINKASA